MIIRQLRLKTFGNCSLRFIDNNPFISLFNFSFFDIGSTFHVFDANLKLIMQAAVSILKQEYNDELTTHKAQLLALRTLHKTLDITKLTPEKVELATLIHANGTTALHVLTADEVK